MRLKYHIKSDCSWTATVFLRRGLAETVDLDALLPEEEEAKTDLLDEIDDLVEFQKKKRTKQYQLMCRTYSRISVYFIILIILIGRYAGDLDGDDPIIVEGDGS